MFVKCLTKQGFKINTYEGCVVNKVDKWKQIIIYILDDYCKISHKYLQLLMVLLLG